MAVYTRGTIFPSRAFDAEGLCNRLRKAMKGLGTDEKTIIEVIGSVDNRQRQQLKQTYKGMFGKDLCEELKSELSGRFEEVVLGLMASPAEYLVDWLNRAMKGLGTDEYALIEILCGKSNQEIHFLRDAYHRKYGVDLERAVRSELSGDFCHLMRAVLAGGRDETLEVDIPKAERDAQELYAAGIGKNLGTDEAKFISILNMRSYYHLRVTFNAYQHFAKHSIEQAIERECSGFFKEGLLAIVSMVRDSAAYFANRLQKAMKGMGTDDNTLIRIIVMRSEVDLADIKQRYQQLYGASLADAIKGETSGDYKKMLLKIIEGS